ncbi:Arc family DNA-binding protein [Stutzerimonas sp. NM35]
MANSRTADKFVVRLPDGLRGRIFDVSARNNRSMNSEIVHRLERSIAVEVELDHQKDLVRILAARLDEMEAVHKSE